ncbi:hypothetical protein ES703_60139 [subsurface metagenome]
MCDGEEPKLVIWVKLPGEPYSVIFIPAFFSKNSPRFEIVNVSSTLIVLT